MQPQAQLGLLLLLPILSCSSPPAHARFGTPIQLADGFFSIEQTEMFADGSRQLLAVHFRYTGNPQHVVAGFFGSDLEFTLIDRDNREYQPFRPEWSPIFPVPEEIYAMLHNARSYHESRGRNQAMMRDVEANMGRFRQLELEMKQGRYPQAWVHLFTVSAESNRLSVRVANPSPKRGQPKALLIPLDR